MKVKIILIAFALIGTIIMSSCNDISRQDTKVSNNEGQDTNVTYTTNDNITNDIQNTPLPESLALIFYEYSDFVQFGSKGVLDPEKYYSADVLVRVYKMVDGAYIDIKSLFDLPDPITDGWSDQVIMHSKNEYNYIVYTKDESNRLKTEYSINVSYNAEYIDKKPTYHKSIIPIDKLSDMNGQAGSFLYRINDVDVIYSKSKDKYIGISLNYMGMSINILFRGSELTISQIQEKCGTTIASLFNESEQLLSTSISGVATEISNRKNHVTK